MAEPRITRSTALVPASLTLTDDVGEFLGQLERGDVLLFDSLHPLSELIKFAENRPVNHAALYLADDTIAHVTRQVPAAHKEKLTQRLYFPPGPYDRTVTALRHKEVKTEHDRSAITNRALSYTDAGNTEYDYLSLAALMVPSLLRSYKHYVRRTQRRQRENSEDEATKTIKDEEGMGMSIPLLQRMARSIVHVFETDKTRSAGKRGRTLTCSEFVYRCFEEADTRWRIDLDSPLGRWPDPDSLRKRTHRPTPKGLRGPGGAAAGPLVARRRGQEGHYVVDGGDLVVFDDTFRADILGRGDGKLGPAAGKRGIGRDVALLTGEVIIDLIWRNRTRGKYDEQADGGAQEGDPLPDLVTPRDLWSSRSLSVVAVLHRPPRPDDQGLDTPH